MTTQSLNISPAELVDMQHARNTYKIHHSSTFCKVICQCIREPHPSAISMMSLNRKNTSGGGCSSDTMVVNPRPSVSCFRNVTMENRVAESRPVLISSMPSTRAEPTIISAVVTLLRSPPLTPRTIALPTTVFRVCVRPSRRSTSSTLNLVFCSWMIKALKSSCVNSCRQQSNTLQ